MSDFYERMAAAASRLIEQFGQQVNLSRTTGRVINPVTGAVTPGVTEVFTPKGIFKSYPDNLIDGTRIKAGDRLVVLDSQVEPQMTDKIEAQGTLWPIQEIITANPAGTPIVYMVRVRA